MLFFTGLILLTIAVSLDSFGIGISYGLSRIHVPLTSIFIIMLCSGMMVLASMMIGNVLSSVLSPDSAKIIGGSILIFIGLFNLSNIIRTKRNEPSTENLKINSTQHEQEKEWKFEIQKLGLLITILKKPQKADLDNSGVISKKEALLLGIALALDAFSAGLGAAMLGYPPILCALLVSVMSGLFVLLGIKSGFILSQKKWMQQVVFLPPCLLISLGLASFL